MVTSKKVRINISSFQTYKNPFFIGSFISFTNLPDLFILFLYSTFVAPLFFFLYVTVPLSII